MEIIEEYDICAVRPVYEDVEEFDRIANNTVRMAIEKRATVRLQFHTDSNNASPVGPVFVVPGDNRAIRYVDSDRRLFDCAVAGVSSELRDLFREVLAQQHPYPEEITFVSRHR